MIKKSINKFFRLFSALAIAFAMAGCGGSDEGPKDPGWDTKPTPSNKEHLVVMSYNIRHCAPYYGPAEDQKNTAAEVKNIADVINSVKPDVVLLQEVDKCTTRSFGLDQTKELSKLCAYPYYNFFKAQYYQNGEYGYAMLSMYPLNDIQIQKIPSVIDNHEIKGYYILGTAKINYKGTEVKMADIHLSVNKSDREKQLPYVLNTFLKDINTPTIFCGDFNDTPDSKIIKDLDAALFIRTNKNPYNLTIPSNNPTKEIDYISYRPADRFKLISHTVKRGVSASDHLPIVAVFDIVK